MRAGFVARRPPAASGILARIGAADAGDQTSLPETTTEKTTKKTTERPTGAAAGAGPVGTRPNDPAEGASGRAAGGDGTLVVNGAERTVPLPCTVAALLERLEMGGKRVAVSVNRTVVPRSRHPEFRVESGDRVEILEAVGGG